MGPPEDVHGSELFLKLQETPRPTEIVAFPRRTADGKPIGKIRIRVLDKVDHDRARKAALARAKENLKLSREDQETALGAALVSDAVACELLAMACCEEKPMAGTDGTETPRYPLVFPGAEAVGKYLTADEVAVLFNCYLLVQSKWGPYEKTVQTEEELSQWVARLVEGAREFPLSQLSSAASVELTSLLARRAYTLSVILESLLPSLPPTLKSRLALYSLGTGFFGSPVVATSGEATETSLKLQVPAYEITIEDAKRMAQGMKEAEVSALAVLDAADATRD